MTLTRVRGNHWLKQPDHANSTRLAHNTMISLSKLPYNFRQLKEAVQACTPCTLVKTRDEDGDRTYTLLDGCGDPMGDAFPDLLEVYYLITNDKDVFNYLARFNK